MVLIVLRDAGRAEMTDLNIISALPGIAEAKVLGVVNDVDLSFSPPAGSDRGTYRYFIFLQFV